jgi:hypothetical protein
MSRKERAAWLQKYAVAHYAKKYSDASRTNPGDMCLCAFVPGPIAVVRLPNIRLHVRVRAPGEPARYHRPNQLDFRFPTV